MATINLGAIKFNWKGAYAGGTAYTVDDVVSSGGSSYVCILASTGNAVSNATYWSIMSSAGTDGTDLTSTLTTEGDTVYKGASALTRLAKGTASQTLQMNAGATAPNWVTVTPPTSDYVKIASSGAIASTASISVDGNFSSDYKVFKLFFDRVAGTSGGNSLLWRMKTTGSYTDYASSTYYYIINVAQQSSSAASNGQSGGWATDYNRIGWCGDGTGDGYSMMEFTFYNPSNSAKRKMSQCHWNGYDNGWWSEGTSGSIIHETAAMTGFKLYAGSGNLACEGWQLYGIK